jgi:Alkylmercury lyase
MTAMAQVESLDRAFRIIVQRLVDTGRAPHYTELARGLGCPVAEGRAILHGVMERFHPGWLFPETDYIASFPPFNNLPTQYRITVAGQQLWFAQCGFESLAITWMFPGQAVRIEAPCLDCGDPMALEMLDGRLLRIEPPEMVGHLNEPYTMSKSRLPFV